MLVAADLQRPAAIQQLHVLGEQLGVPVYSEQGATNPVLVCQNAVKKAARDQMRTSSFWTRPAGCTSTTS